jgi:hypothetical protein
LKDKAKVKKYEDEIHKMQTEYDEFRAKDEKELDSVSFPNEFIFVENKNRG